MPGLRVAGGEARGRRLKAPKGIRPTQGMVKEAIFNLIGPGIAGVHVLDLFAGRVPSASRRFRAARQASPSWTASRVVLLSCARTWKSSISRRMRTWSVVRSRAGSRSSHEEIARAGVIFLDPPYEDVALDRALKVIDRAVGGATVLVEHSRRQELPSLTRMHVDRQRRYGDTMVTRAARMNHQPKTAVYPGSFDPFTNGHLDVVERALKIFDQLIIAVAANPEKRQPLFSVEERIELISSSLKGRDGVEVASFTGLTVEYARSRGATTLVKGLRAYSDFDAELQQALMNRKLAPDIHTVFLMSGFAHIFVSSSILKDIASYGGNVADLVPPPVAKALKEKYR